MSENNLTYCPEGGEHEWLMWSDTGKLVVDCNCCAQVALRETLWFTADLDILGIPVQLERMSDGLLKIRPRREV